jgi:hypothetical protein
MNTYWIIEWLDGTHSVWPVALFSAMQILRLRRARRVFLLSTV